MRYRVAPKPGSRARRRFDALVAGAILAVMIVINLLFWGPIPAGGLWLGSQASYHTGDNLFLGICVAFFVCLGALMLGLIVLKRLDSAWMVVRRAAGHDQREGMISTLFAICAVVGASAFTFWLLFIGGLGSSLAPS